MSDIENIDVTSLNDTSPSLDADKIKCIYCGCLKDGVLMFYCKQCLQWIHANCLHSGPPSQLLADNFYNFKCSNCTLDQKEMFKRMKLTWVQVVSLTLYNLAQTNLGKQGYFKWKEDICDFIEKHWEIFFNSEKKNSHQWFCTVASILSSGNPHRFQSGYSQFGETGWWRLSDPIKPPEYNPSASAVTFPRSRGARKSHFGMSSRSTVRKRQLALQLSEARAKKLFLKNSNKTISEVSSMKAAQAANDNAEPSLSATSAIISSLSHSGAENISQPNSPANSASNESTLSKIKEAKVDPHLPLAAISDDECDNIVDDISAITNEWGNLEDIEIYNDVDRTTKSINVVRSNFPANDGESKNGNLLRPMSLYDEQKLLKKLLTLPNVDDNLEGRRMRRKLQVRQKKRELGLSVFNFDATVRKLRAKEKGLKLDPDDLDAAVPFQLSTDYRILDRFLAPNSRVGVVEESSRLFVQKLIGSDESDYQMIVSPYTQRVLKPFIRRDYETKPPKLRLLQDIVSYRRRSNSNLPPTSKTAFPIDYCYVRPHHIPTVNALCRHFFWPSVDLTESLQYPDFSVIALYRKMVIGFGFLVPDVAFNEAYISFLFVHPDWRRAGVGSFMLYHLIQTCMGKDLTLHVSASNPAMLLYQRFAFKPEKFEADFYDKYLPVDARECNHAFFMRLRR